MQGSFINDATLEGTNVLKQRFQNLGSQSFLGQPNFKKGSPNFDLFDQKNLRSTFNFKKLHPEGLTDFMRRAAHNAVKLDEGEGAENSNDA